MGVTVAVWVGVVGGDGEGGSAGFSAIVLLLTPLWSGFENKMFCRFEMSAKQRLPERTSNLHSSLMLRGFRIFFRD